MTILRSYPRMMGLSLSQQLYPLQSRKDKGTAGIYMGEKIRREILGPVGHTGDAGREARSPEDGGRGIHRPGLESSTQLHCTSISPLKQLSCPLTSATGHSSLPDPPCFSPPRRPLQPPESELGKCWAESPAMEPACTGL